MKALRLSNRYTILGTIIVALSLFSLHARTPLCAAPLSFASAQERVTVVELFTSQGCSSCPPAEKWLNAFKDDPALWRKFVPIAWHVDYWDQLGWTDRFALSKHSRRQYRYAEQGNIRSVYTPGVIVNGKEWRRWIAGFRPSKETIDAGRLEMTLSGDKLSVSYRSDTATRQAFLLSIAVLGSNLHTEIKAGENRGRKLPQDFVVLGYKELAPNDINRWNTGLPEFTSHPGARYALAAWISQPGDQTPLQASGGWLPSDLRVSGSLD